MKKEEIKSLITSWLSSDVINKEQAKYMIDDVMNVTSEKSGHKFISAVIYIGATALSMGALLLIASNWSGFSKSFKLILALILPIVPITFAYWQLIVKDKESVLGRAASILGMALVGGSLALIGQIYNLESNMVNFLWTWALLTAPFIFVFRRKENVFFSALLLGPTLFLTIVQFVENSLLDVSFGVILMTVVALGYSLFLYLVGSAMRNSAEWLESGQMLRISGASLASITFFIMTFEFYAQSVAGSTYANPGSWEILSVVFNLLFIGYLIFAIVRSIKFEEYSFAFSLVRLFALYLLVKYFTLFYSMFDTGLFFIIGGVLFIAGGLFLEKKKDLLVSYMKGTIKQI
jgi:uncharacterized membrane protein